jgi:arsenite methyltransferase
VSESHEGAGSPPASHSDPPAPDGGPGGADALREAVRMRYAAAAGAVERGGDAETVEGELIAANRERAAGAATCCSGAPIPACGEGCGSTSGVSSALYSPEELAALPDAAARASLGCGNPTALIDLRPGEVVLDLGSGGGIDVLLSARRVGPTGFAYGVDMTDEMLALAERNAAEQGAGNVRFLKGTIEDVPLPDASVDVVISNCVINLSADKSRVLGEAFRVLRPGGRFAVADVVVQGALPEAVRRDLELWVGCVAGALEDAEYRSLLTAAGFQDVEIVAIREHTRDGGKASAEGRVVSAFVRARKPE